MNHARPSTAASPGRGVRLLVLAIKIVLGVSVAIYAAIMVSPSPKPRLALLGALHRTGGCSFAETLDSADYERDLEAVRDRFRGASRIVQRDRDLDLVDTPAGRWWVNHGDRSLTFLLSEQQHQIYGTGIEGVQKGDVVLDCGANVGVFTRTALNRGARLVIAIEIAPPTIECLRRNFSEEISHGRVVIYPKGVWNRPDLLEMSFVDPSNAGENSVVLGRQVSNKIRVPVTTIDLIAAELNLDRVDFIKMDIEGAEAKALQGGQATIRHFRPRMAISCEHLPSDVKEIPQVVNTIQPGYQVRASDCYDFFSRVRPAVFHFRY